jgi:hypothetical protein
MYATRSRVSARLRIVCGGALRGFGAVHVGESETAEGEGSAILGGGRDKAGGDVMPCHAFWGFFPFSAKEKGVGFCDILIFGYFLLAARVSIWSLDVLSPRVVERGQFLLCYVIT